MHVGSLSLEPAAARPDLVAPPVAAFLQQHPIDGLQAVAIDPALSDTAAFCEHYGVGMDVSANCVIIEARRGETVRYAACLVLATDRADVNGIVRRHMDARKASFAPMDTAVSLTGMEYGGITPLGLPADWPVLIDEAVAAKDAVIIGSGMRASKLVIGGAALGGLPGAVVMPLVRRG